MRGDVANGLRSDLIDGLSRTKGFEVDMNTGEKGGGLLEVGTCSFIFWPAISWCVIDTTDHAAGTNPYYQTEQHTH